jgi:hypothetical protein
MSEGIFDVAITSLSFMTPTDRIFEVKAGADSAIIWSVESKACIMFVKKNSNANANEKSRLVISFILPATPALAIEVSTKIASPST